MTQLAMAEDLVHRLRRRAIGARNRLLAPITRRLGVITHVRSKEPVVALTFDDGPNPESTPRVLDLLHRYGARATFFVVGEMAARHPELLERIAAEGHAIGNHSWNHPSFPMIEARERVGQIARCEMAIAAHSNRLFRPPFGDLDWPSRWQLFVRGYTVIGWNASCLDWQPRDAASMQQALERQMKPGGIVLLHDQLFAYATSDEPSRAQLLAALEQVLIRGAFRFVTVPELLHLGRVQARFWIKRSERDWLVGLDSCMGLGFKY
jgi:peptidoglycan/xylan/chitin deacetylase (PgdA/CDA1 family)